jgi:alcohol dehydrogenase (cytochrome c)
MIRVFQATLLIGSAILATERDALAQTARGPSTENLLKADKDTANWVLPARSYSGNRQVDESEISPQNVDQMKVAWTFKLPGNDPVETAPIVWDGTVYVTSGRDDVFALDAKTGEVKWQYRPNARQQVGFPRNRGVAIYDGMVFIGMIDGHIAALDAKTGKEIWNRQAVDDPRLATIRWRRFPIRAKSSSANRMATGAASAM